MHEFACHSKSCAPPPAGVGGSSKVGRGGSSRAGEIRNQFTKTFTPKSSSAADVTKAFRDAHAHAAKAQPMVKPARHSTSKVKMTQAMSKALKMVKRGSRTASGHS